MEIASFGNKEIVFAEDASFSRRNLIGSVGDRGGFFCPSCHARLILVHGSGQRRPYFRTAPNSMHSRECEHFALKEIDIQFDDVTEISESKPSFEMVSDVSSKVTLKIIEMFATSPHLLRTMDRRHFEELVAELFHGFGYSVELTKQTRDGGKDIIAISNDRIIPEKYIIECKRPDIGNPVRLNVVKNLHATKIDEGANKAILVTTSTFTRDARAYQEKHNIDLQLNDFNDLVDWLYIYLQSKNG
ncbi:restriction endonuclease [Vibrio sp. 1408]|uniref:restriction endonuclease n=1 Tax=Vibrio sp. 1408 TaxID=3074557 RepID=UPI002966147C|nr:restriction endonuclease [Vibrio sp. 1408]MDW3052012.1 restriction endonuclease [Vibrio sp. 1408]